jgi:hypothetical protein
MQKTLILASIALIACGDSGKDTGDTALSTTGGTGGGGGGTGGTTGYTYTGPLVVVSAASGCVTAGSGMNWQIDGETMGWTGGSTYNSWETGNVNGWNEEHSLLSIAYAPDQSSDTLQRTLTALGDTDGDGYSDGEYVEDVSTLFSCGVHDVDPVMTYAIRVYDLSGNFADCGIWATDSGGVAEVLADPSGGWFNPVSAATEIADCVELM